MPCNLAYTESHIDIPFPLIGGMEQPIAQVISGPWESSYHPTPGEPLQDGNRWALFLNLLTAQNHTVFPFLWILAASTDPNHPAVNRWISSIS